MHFTISNSHIFNFNGPRLHGQGHSTNNFSSFTIHIVVYLLNKYLLRALATAGISPGRPEASPGAYLETVSSLSPALWHCGPGQAFLERWEDLATKFLPILPIHCSRALLLAHKCLHLLHWKRNGMCLRMLSYYRGIIPERKSFEGGKWSVYFKHLF